MIMADSLIQPLLSVRDLSVAFHVGGRDVLAVDRVSFDIAKGQTVALVGESGSGKSVTALSVMKLLPYPSASHPSGKIQFKGQELIGKSDAEMRHIRGNDISIIFQEPMTSLNPLHIIERQIGEILALHRGLAGEAARKRTVELLGLCGVPDPESRLASYPHQLSGGQRQRVMIAMALANEPDLLIADEPTTALDVTIQAQILELLDKLRADFDSAVILITHDLGVVAEFADDILVMYAGRVVERGSKADIFYDPQMPYTWGLLGSIPRLDRPKPEKLHSIKGSPPSLINLPRGCTFRPRCPHAFDKCFEEPDLRRRVEEPETHLDRCWLPVDDKRRLRQATIGEEKVA